MITVKFFFDGELSKIIEKYADHKVLSVVLSKEVPREKLEKLADVVEVEYPKVVFSVKRKEVSTKAAQILKELPVEDLNIEEVEIEEIIRRLFGEKGS